MDAVKLRLAKNGPGPFCLPKVDPVQFWLAKNGPGPVLAGKNGPGPVLADKNGPGPVLARVVQFWRRKVDRPVHFLPAKSGPGPLFVDKKWPVGPLFARSKFFVTAPIEVVCVLILMKTSC